MNFKEIFDEVFTEEEKKDSNGVYINNVLLSFSKSFIFYLTKIKLFLQFEEQRQDENHWKDELRSPLGKILGGFGGAKSKDEMLNKLFEHFEEDYKYTEAASKAQYSDFYNKVKNFRENIQNIAVEYYPKLVDWLFDNFYKIRKLDGDERKEAIKNACKEFTDAIN